MAPRPRRSRPSSFDRATKRRREAAVRIGKHAERAVDLSRAEVGAEDWRGALEDAAANAASYSITRDEVLRLGPVLNDLGVTEVHESLQEYFTERDIEIYIANDPLARHALEQLTEQILNASDEQIIGYQVLYLTSEFR